MKESSAQKVSEENVLKILEFFELVKRKAAKAGHDDIVEIVATISIALEIFKHDNGMNMSLELERIKINGNEH